MTLADSAAAVTVGAPTDTRASVPRQALLRRLGARPATRVVTLTGPAGSGKTTLLRQWSAQDDRPHVLVPLAPYLDDPTLLAGALLGALERIGPTEPAAYAVLTGAEPTFSAIVEPGFRDLAATRDRPYVVVLDDLHLLRSEGSLRLVRALADGIAPGSTLVLASRTPGPAWLGRVRADGDLLDIGPGELAFDADETAELLVGLGLHPDGAEVDRLLTDSEGWAVALYLLGLARRDAHVPTQRDVGTEFVADYIRSEVLEPLSVADRTFLVLSAVLDEHRGDLCDAVLDRSDSEVVLNRIAASTTLLSRRTASDATAEFHYHHLLLDTLRRELAEGTDAATIAGLHARAATWFAERRQCDAAVRHARLSGDVDLLARLVWAATPDSAGSGRSDAVRRWLAEIPASQVLGNRWLSLSAAWAALQEGRADERERWLLHCEELAGRGWRSRARDEEYAAELTIIEALVGRYDLATMPDRCDDALAGMAPDSPFRAPAAFLLGAGLTLTRRPGGDDALELAGRYARALDVPVIDADTRAFRGMLLILRSEMSAGIALIEESAELIHEHRLERLATSAHTITASALALALRQDRAAAQRQLGAARRLTLVVAGIAPWFQVVGPVVQARTALILGDVPQARALVGEARAALRADMRGSMLEELLVGTEDAVRASAQSAANGATLTPAELRVLAFLPSHLTFRQIGEHLFLSASTVKTHALAIYRKLGVGSRDDAVLTARRLGLLEAPLRS